MATRKRCLRARPRFGHQLPTPGTSPTARPAARVTAGKTPSPPRNPRLILNVDRLRDRAAYTLREQLALRIRTFLIATNTAVAGRDLSSLCWVTSPLQDDSRTPSNRADQ